MEQEEKMIGKTTHRLTTVLAGLSAIATILGLNTTTNALSLNFKGRLAIDFSSDPLLGSMMGQKTLDINDVITLPFTEADILASLADGDSTIPFSFLLERFFPQEIIPQVLRLDKIEISHFSGTGSVSSAKGFLTNFDFVYGEVFEQPVIELTNFTKNLAQCVFIQCQYAIATHNPALLSASFEATLLTPLISSAPSLASTTLTVSNAPVSASFATQAVPESLNGLIFPFVFAGIAFLNSVRLKR